MINIHCQLKMLRPMTLDVAGHVEVRAMSWPPPQVPSVSPRMKPSWSKAKTSGMRIGRKKSASSE
jgi:hypothetical protein